MVFLLAKQINAYGDHRNDVTHLTVQTVYDIRRRGDPIKFVTYLGLFELSQPIPSHASGRAHYLPFNCVMC